MCNRRPDFNDTRTPAEIFRDSADDALRNGHRLPGSAAEHAKSATQSAFDVVRALGRVESGQDAAWFAVSESLIRASTHRRLAVAYATAPALA